MSWDHTDDSGCPSWGSRSSDYASSKQGSEFDMWNGGKYEDDNTTLSGGSFRDNWSCDQGYWTASAAENDKTTMYCTPRTLSAVESITNLWSNNGTSLGLTHKRNIWSTSYHDESADLVEPETSDYHAGAVFKWKHTPSPFDTGSASPFSVHTEMSLPGLTSSSSSSPSPSLQKNKVVFHNLQGKPFEVPENSRFFVIKSYNAIDVSSSINHGVWTSTDLGNRRLDQAYQDAAKNGGKIFLFFSVNSSGKFCGVAEMKDKIDFTKTRNIWVEKSRWKGIFPLEWHLVKDIPNRNFSSLRVPSNENKPVTNSRDTQEMPYQVGVSMLKIFVAHKYNPNFLHTSSTQPTTG